MKENWLRLVIALILTIGAILWATRGLDLAATMQTLAGASLGWSALALASVVLTSQAKSMRWAGLINRSATSLSGPSLLELVLTGQLLNFALPLRAGDVARVWWLGQLYPKEGKAWALGTLAAEKLLDSVALLTLGLIVTLSVAADRLRTEGILGRLDEVRLGGGLALLALACVAIALASKLPLSPRLQEIVLRLQAGLVSLRNPRQVTIVSLWSVACWGLAASTNWLAYRALGLQPSLQGCLALLLVLQAGVTVPAPPGRIGIFQALCVLTLVPFGLSPVQALAYGVLLYVVVILPPLLGGGWMLLRLRDAQSPQVEN